MSDKVRLDQTAINQHEHDPVSRAKKTKIVDTIMEINVDADDGDSVEIRPMRKTIQASAQEVIDCSEYYAICVYGSTQPDFFISPDPSGDEWYSMGSLPIGQTVAITASRIRFNQDLKIILRT